MLIQNKKTGQKFPTTLMDWEEKIAGKGFADKYEILEDGKPIELRQLSVEILKQKKGAKNK